MRRSLAPSCVVSTGEISTDGAQAQKGCTDQSTGSAVLPARKRKFAAPALVATDKSVAASGVTEIQVRKIETAVKDNAPVEHSGTPAQYFSVLYTKRNANKVHPESMALEHVL